MVELNQTTQNNLKDCTFQALLHLAGEEKITTTTHLQTIHPLPSHHWQPSAQPTVTADTRHVRKPSSLHSRQSRMLTTLDHHPSTLQACVCHISSPIKSYLSSVPTWTLPHTWQALGSPHMISSNLWAARRKAWMFCTDSQPQFLFASYATINAMS